MRALILFMVTVLAACGGGGGGGSNTSSPPPVNPIVTTVYEVQGDGPASPLVGQAVTVEGIVTGDFQDNDADTSRNLGGFYIQSAPDGDFSTSDGVFIFDGTNPAVDVDADDLVRVSGTVNEHFGETQISANSVTIIGNGSLIPAPVNLPAVATITNSDGRLVADLERFEGMLIRLPQTLTVTELWELEQYGSVVLSQGGNQYQYTTHNTPDVAGFNAHLEAIASRQLLLDDGQRIAGVSPIRYLAAGVAPNYSIRVGDQITDVTGTLRYSRGSGSGGFEGYRLMPTGDPQFASMNPRPGEPVLAGSLKVTSFNVLNFFSTIDTGADDCGPSGNSGCRGADSAEELARQLAKTVTAIGMIDADIVGLIELENNASESLQVLVDALNVELGAGTFDYVATGIVGSSVIKNGFLYKPATVSLVGPAAILDSGFDARFDDLRNRPVIAQTFSQNSNGARLTVAVNHLKSKGSNCDAAGDPNLGDGQDDCNLTRTNAAAALADWLATDPTASGDADALIIGDLNAHTLEDPLTTLKNSGFTNLAESMIGLDAYSFVFEAQRGTLDHALASASLAPQVVGIEDWHINADEPQVLDYNLESGRDPSLFDDATPYRASDHDPLVISLDLTL